MKYTGTVIITITSHLVLRFAKGTVGHSTDLHILIHKVLG